MLDFGREICGHLPIAERCEWLVTNGIGGYASGTVAGLLTRRYHGLLIAALQPPLGRTLLLTRLDETAINDGRAYGLISCLRSRFLIVRSRRRSSAPSWTSVRAICLLLTDCAAWLGMIRLT
jgi:glycogen debranching enzyme